MNLTGVVAEYNPFHKGHEYQLKMARELSSCDGIVVVMSGNFVQRGEPAIIDKFKRAEAAVYGGADLVIELPMPFSSQNAEMFANAAIKELNKLHINNLSFGCESTDIELMKKIANLQLSDKFNREIKCEIKNGISYPKALSNVISSLLGEEAYEIANSPNNVLGIEYIKSALKHNLSWNFVPIVRIGKEHNDLIATGHYDSATAIRKVLLDSPLNSISVPPKSREKINEFYEKHGKFNYFNNYLSLLYYKIIELGPEKLNDIYEVTEGLNNKIYSNVFMHNNIDDFIMSLKSKRYTYSKLRRVLLNILLDLTNDDIRYFMSTNTNYVKVLAFNDIGRNIIKETRQNGTILITRYSDYNKYNLNASELPLFKLTDKSTNIYNISLDNKNLNTEYTLNSIYVKNIN